ncbi:MAG: ATP-dependent DNA ligase [Acidimicrobiia bacterium]|nr:ATP-dependent DNA ligase [Acidimicrobiia bacterium]
MLARLVEALPAEWWYEPKWDGFRALIFRDGAEVRIESRNQRPLARYFPEVVSAVKQALPERCVVDGEIVTARPDDGRLDFYSLQQRLHPAASRVDLLASQTPATLIAFDLIASDDEDLRPLPFHERRHRLEALLEGVAPGVSLTPLTDDLEVAGEWFKAFEGAGLDGIIAKHPASTYQPGRRVMAKLKHDRTADCVVVGYRTHKSRADAIGSLLLALYSEEGTPAHFDTLPPLKRLPNHREELVGFRAHPGWRSTHAPSASSIRSIPVNKASKPEPAGAENNEL